MNAMKSNQSRNIGLAALVAVLLSGAVCAEEPAREKFRLAVGGFSTNRIDSTLSLTDADAGIGASFSPRDTLGLQVESTALRVEGYYRFDQENALTYSWYRIRSTGNKVVEEDFEWADENGDPITIPVGADVRARLETEIFKLGYLWSFYHSDKMEVGVGGGLHASRLTVGLDADRTNPSGSTVKRVDTTWPMPVITLGMNYRVTPKFSWYLKTEVFALSFDKYVGTYLDTLSGVEYRAWKHVGLGAAINASSLNLEEDDARTKLIYQESMSGALLYVATYF